VRPRTRFVEKRAKVLRWSDIVVLPFFSMVDRRKALHHSVIESVRTHVLCMLATEIKSRGASA